MELLMWIGIILGVYMVLGLCFIIWHLPVCWLLHFLPDWLASIIYSIFMPAAVFWDWVLTKLGL